MHTRPPRRAWPWALAALASCLALSVSGQDAEPAPPPAAVWEYSQLAWTPEDTTSVLRQVTGADPLVDAKQLADRLKADLGELRFDPRLFNRIVDCTRILADRQVAGMNGAVVAGTAKRHRITGAAGNCQLFAGETFGDLRQPHL